MVGALAAGLSCSSLLGSDATSGGSGGSSSGSGQTSGSAGCSCASDEVCVGNQCFPTACAGQACPAQEICVNGACLAISCVGVDCPAGERCSNGECWAVDGGRMDGGFQDAGPDGGIDGGVDGGSPSLDAGVDAGSSAGPARSLGSALVVAGTSCASASYQLIHSVGQPSAGEMRSASTNYTLSRGVLLEVGP
jgi:hypothetical protein